MEVCSHMHRGRGVGRIRTHYVPCVPSVPEDGVDAHDVCCVLCGVDDGRSSLSCDDWVGRCGSTIPCSVGTAR